MNGRVLVYSPYSEWYLHTLYEVTIAHGLRHRNAEVRFVSCDGLFSDCDVHWAATSPRTPESCRACMSCAHTVFEGLATPWQWLGAQVSREQRREAARWANELSEESLLEARYEGYPLGRWVKSSVHSHFRMNELDLQDAGISRVYRSYLASGALALQGLRRQYDDFRPDAILMLNGRFFSHRIAFELARERGIRVLVHERGAQDNTLAFWENENCHSFDTLLALWEDWKNVPLTADQIEQVKCLLGEREGGRNTGWKSFVSPKQDTNALAHETGLKPGQRMVALFTSSDDEMAASEGWEPVMDQLDWIGRSVNWFAEHPDYLLVVRVHPNTAGITGANAQFLEGIRKLEADLPDNVRLLYPEEKVNSYQLVDESVACLVYSSTIALEASARGRPVLMSGGGFLFGREYATNLETADAYERTLSDFLSAPVDADHVRYALRFVYHRFVRTSLPFSMVSVIEVHHARVNYRTVDELRPGSDPVLDRACEFLLEGRPIYGRPALAAGAGSSAEDAAVREILEGTQDRAKSGLPAEVPAVTVSVVVTCYNYADYLKESVGSVLLQSFQDIELIIVNDGSTDRSLEIAEGIRDANPQRAIRVIDQPNSGQPAISRNNGIRQARGRYILCLDADDMLAPQMIGRCVELLEADPAVAIAYTDRLDFDGVDQVVQAGDYNFEQLRYQNHISYCAVYRREVWDAIGGYRLNVKGCEDWDFWVGAGARGYRGKRIPEPLFLYRRHDTGLYQHALENFDQKRMQIVLNNREVYPDSDIQIAARFIDAQSAPNPSQTDVMYQGQERSGRI